MINVLIVEDERIAAEYLRRIIEQVGYSVVGIAKSSDEAFALLKHNAVDAVLTDIMIQGGQSGAEFAVALRQISQCAIIFTTAYADEEMVEYAVLASVDGYLIKPLVPKEVLVTLKLALKRRRFMRTGNDEIITLQGGYKLHRNGSLFKEVTRINITSKMRELLEYLAKNPNHYHSTQAISSALWGRPDCVGALRTLIYRLRQTTSEKLIDASVSEGYRLHKENI
ncbi:MULTISPECIES: response regulator [unclassified Sulfurospirillum]|uniref:response regulator n=1 Tax=unclassified Sulfurospirillum TaxID=2618290 RepID=UPI0005005BF9|nr:MULTISPECIES: response regulator [unclassified Sulfurospirillum]KFL33530.1 hypothetical protein JU57_11055 [Sulfurospirillum sp. SCADC]